MSRTTTSMHSRRPSRSEIAAIVLEPIQGEGGIHPGTPEYLRAARQIAEQHGALLIADEIQTGFRTGAPFVFPTVGVTPDLLVAAKAVGNGFPVGVTAMTDAIAEKLPAGDSWHDLRG